MKQTTETVGNMSTRKLKREIRQKLADQRYNEITDLVSSSSKVGSSLMRLLYDKEPVICHRAALCIGLVAGVEAKIDLEKVRGTLRRLLWTMNDESGSICWYAPEAIGEILVNVPEMLDEFGNILPSFIKEEPFERGTYYALWRLVTSYGERFSSLKIAFKLALSASDPAIRGYSAMALKALGYQSEIKADELLAGVGAEFDYFDPQRGEVIRERLGSICQT